MIEEFVEFKYRISQPDALVRVYSNADGKGYPDFKGITDIDGYARDSEGRHPFLKPGTWYFFVDLPGWTFEPDARVVLEPRKDEVKPI